MDIMADDEQLNKGGRLRDAELGQKRCITDMSPRTCQSYLVLDLTWVPPCLIRNLYSQGPLEVIAAFSLLSLLRW